MLKEGWGSTGRAAREERAPPPVVVLDRQLEVGERDRDKRRDLGFRVRV